MILLKSLITDAQRDLSDPRVAVSRRFLFAWNQAALARVPLARISEQFSTPRKAYSLKSVSKLYTSFVEINSQKPGYVIAGLKLAISPLRILAKS